ncbi:hypothetical protein ACM26V_07025 [Salipaludibacillus sp. HK11]|uniref:hypothetical protein n=1 Tax=Salipaludibacillus sp. HK11 TaxID=3394320 RepID=UPI0039FDBC0E
MKKVFEVTYKGHHILVENRWFSGEKLYVNGRLQDENLGLSFRGTLTGVINPDNGKSMHIKVTMGGNVRINCRIFVDNELIYPEKY